MGSDPRAVDADGVRVERDARVQVAIAGGVAVMLIAVATLVALVWLGDDAPHVAAAPAPAPVADVARAPAAQTPTHARRRPPAADTDAPGPPSRREQRAAARAAVAAKADAARPELTLQDVLPYLPAGEAREGIALFPAPGTNPPKRGLVVPEDFPLPEGFLRHYQATDDGTPLPPILMLHPDYELVDDAGNAIALPDGVVPPELAPAGMPHELLELPATPRAAD